MTKAELESRIEYLQRIIDKQLASIERHKATIGEQAGEMKAYKERQSRLKDLVEQIGAIWRRPIQ